MNFINNNTSKKIDFDNNNNNKEIKYALTEKNHSTFLDYTFAYQSTLINEGTIIDPSKIKDYHYDLEETFSLNINMLKNIKNYNFYINNVNNNNDKLNNNIIKENSEETKEIKKLINTIIEKNENKKNQIKLIKNIKQKILNKKQILEQTRLDLEKIKMNSSIKIDELNNLLNSKNKYIQIIYQRLNNLNSYIKNLNNNERKNIINLEDFFNLNNNYNQNKKFLNNKIQLILNNLNNIKKENEIYLELKSLYNIKKPNINLIRVANFYIEFNNEIKYKNHLIKKKLDKFIKILNFLNYQDIGNFAINQNDLSVTHYEMNFSKVGIENTKNKKFNKEEEEFNLIEKINKLMDFQSLIDKFNKSK